MSGSIATLVASCITLLEKLEKDTLSTDASPVWVNEQKITLRIWAAQLGLDSLGHSLIDRQLRNSYTVTLSIVRILEVLLQNLRLGSLRHRMSVRYS
jgi:hypothetical protein